MTRFPILAALLALSACAAPAAPQRAEASPDHAACRAEAEATPEARDAARRAMPNNPTVMDSLRAERARAVETAYRDCLRRRGLLRGGGGVEAVRR